MSISQCLSISDTNVRILTSTHACMILVTLTHVLHSHSDLLLCLTFLGSTFVIGPGDT